MKGLSFWKHLEVSERWYLQGVALPLLAAFACCRNTAADTAIIDADIANNIMVRNRASFLSLAV
jgi:hypothetical protein